MYSRIAIAIFVCKAYRDANLPWRRAEFRVCAPDLIANLKVIAGEPARQLVVT
ncbi:hypothetical protein EMEDMD4_1170008 [Sinorhizobium medicae]|uniref:Uncharacterized protein n=1 Tax=Sinorhizobium medicae TaxID=110321 RepID=A0A508WVC4_9HYPH|nr:hypothetical protein EMEDMD4_1170008 [Sinorhizobium medicae]